MRLATYEHEGALRPALAVGDRLVDAGAAAQRAGLGGDPRTLASVRALLTDRADDLERLHEAAAQLIGAGESVALADVRLGPPVPDPGKILCVGLNYREHASEARVDEPEVPRGIDVDRHGFIYVAEAGRGGAGPCIPGAEGGQVCLGQTGAIMQIAFGKQRRIVRGQPSTAAEGTGAGASGPQDVDVRRFGRGSFVTGLGANPTARDDLGDGGDGLAKLVAKGPDGDEDRLLGVLSQRPRTEMRPRGTCSQARQ